MKQDFKDSYDKKHSLIFTKYKKRREKTNKRINQIFLLNQNNKLTIERKEIKNKNNAYNIKIYSMFKVFKDKIINYRQIDRNEKRMIINLSEYF